MHNLRVSLFACETGLARSMGWDRVIYYFDESEMIGVDIRATFDEWLTRNEQRLSKPINLAVRLLRAHESLTVDAVDHSVSLISPDHRQTFNGVLYRLLVQGCQKAVVQDLFNSNATPQKQLCVQYAPGSPLQVVV